MDSHHPTLSEGQGVATSTTLSEGQGVATSTTLSEGQGVATSTTARLVQQQPSATGTPAQEQSQQPVERGGSNSTSGDSSNPEKPRPDDQAQAATPATLFQPHLRPRGAVMFTLSRLW